MAVKYYDKGYEKEAIDNVLFGVFEQCFYLVHRVEVADEFLWLRALHSVHGIVFKDLLADGVFEGGVQQIVIMQNRLLTVAVLAQVIVEAVNESWLAVGKRDLFVKVFRHLSTHSSLVAVVCGLLDLVDVYTVEPVVYELQKRIFGRIVVAVKEALVLAFKLVLRLSDSLVDERFRGAGRQSKPQPFFALLHH